MKHLRYPLAITLLFLGIVILSLPFRADAATTTYASDSFSRTNTDSWGSAATGGAYTIVGTKANFDVNGSVGTIVEPLGVKQSAYLTSVSAASVEATFRVKTDKASAGGAQIAYLVVRRISEGNNYLGRLRMPADGTVRLAAYKELGGTATMIGSEAVVAGLTHTANSYIRVRLQASGTNPTTLRLRAWADGQTEPTSWQYTSTDSTASLQTNGSVGVRAYLASTVTNAPVLFSVDDFVVTSVSSTPTPTSTPKPTATATPVPLTGAKVYWGALIDGSIYGLTTDPPYNMTGLNTFESHGGKQVSILRWGQPWHWKGHAGYSGIGDGYFQKFPTTQMNAVRSRGTIPYLDWAAWEMGGGASQPNFQNADVYNGTYDAYIHQWAQDAKAWGHPFFLRLNPELNGWWYPWGEGRDYTGAIVNGNQPGDLVKAWRHVHDIFITEGATNATWLWSINMMTTATTGPYSYPATSSVYPGDSYVNWSGLSLYNKYSNSISFASLMTGSGQSWLRNSYQEVLNVAPTKPMMLAETGAFEYNNDPALKAAWITDFLSTLPVNFPKVKAFTWYDAHDVPGDTFPIESSAAAQSAFKAGIASSSYAANSFDTLNTSPIPAP